MKNNMSYDVKKMCGVAVFSALAFCVALITNIPVGIFTFDAKDAIITVASFIYGPTSAAAMSVITALLEFITVGNTGIYGLLMDLVSTLAFTLTASLIYKYKRSLVGALVSLGSAVVIYVAVMMVANLIITPLYMGVTAADVRSMIPTVLLPFNLAKALMNSSVVMLIYKPVSKLAKRIGFAGSYEGHGSKKNTKDTFIMLGIATAVFIVAMVIFITLN